MTNDVDLATQAARLGAVILLKHWEQLGKDDADLKSRNDWVSRADRDSALVGRTPVLHLHGGPLVTPRVECVQANSVPSAQGQQVATAQVVLQTEAVLLDQRDPAAQAAAIWEVRPTSERTVALALHGRHISRQYRQSMRGDRPLIPCQLR